MMQGLHTPTIAQQVSPLPLAFAAVDWAVVGLYLLFVMALGGWFAWRHRSAASRDYFLAGRSMSGWVVTLSLLATSLSAATYVGAPDQAFHGDLTFLILYLGNVAAVVLVAIFFVPKLWAAGTTTIYGFLGRRFGVGGQRAAGVTFLFGRLLASGSRLFLAATPLFVILTAGQEGTKLQLIGCVILIGLVGTAYTLLGGIRAVMWTDTLQLALIFGAAGLTAVVLFQRIDLPVGEIISTLRAAETPAGTDKLAFIDASLNPTRPFTLWTAIIGNLIFFAAVFGTDHDMAQRFMTAKSAKTGARAVMWSQAVGFAATALFMVIGLLLWVYYRQVAPDRAPGIGEPVYVSFLAFELPPIVAGLAVAGLFAAAQSTMDSATNSLASSAINDVWRPDTRPHHPQAAAAAADLPPPLHPDAAAAAAGIPPRVPATQPKGADVTIPAASAAASAHSHSPAPAHHSHAAPAFSSSPREPGNRGKPAWWMSAATGSALTLFAVICVLIYDPQQQTFIDFALSVMTLAVCGLLGVFLCALFTRRGAAWSVIAALAVGFILMLLSQPMVQRPLLGEMKFHWFWGVPVAVAASFGICCIARGKR